MCLCCSVWGSRNTCCSVVNDLSEESSMTSSRFVIPFAIQLGTLPLYFEKLRRSIHALTDAKIGGARFLSSDLLRCAVNRNSCKVPQEI